MTGQHRGMCVVCGRREPAPGLRTCWPDRDRLAAHLDPANKGQPFRPAEPAAPVRRGSIPVLYAELAELRPPLGERPGEYADAAVFDAHRASLRDVRSKATGPGRDDDGVGGPPSVLASLGGWAQAAHEEHVDLHGCPAALPVLVPPGRRGVRPPDVVAVETLSGWLHARVDWLAARDWVDELVTDLRGLTAQLRAGTGDPGMRALGPCPARVDNDGCPDDDGPWSCAWPLHMPEVGPRAPDEPIVPPAVRCGSCGTRWGGLELLWLARDLGGLAAAGARADA